MVIVGLGNPGERYDGTRHNVGRVVVEGLAGAGFTSGRGDYLRKRTSIGGSRVQLVLPLVFMNDSGRAVVPALEEAGAEPSELLVVCDDVNLDLERLRLRPSGTDGGHNGLASVIERLGTTGFGRLRLGVGAPPDDVDLADYVLSPFEPEERPRVDGMVTRARDALRCVAREGFARAMSEYNRQPGPDEGPGT
jgi:PTH1 family peptidyl-tRNA hydrolase